MNTVTRRLALVALGILALALSACTPSTATMKGDRTATTATVHVTHRLAVSWTLRSACHYKVTLNGPAGTSTLTDVPTGQDGSAVRYTHGDYTVTVTTTPGAQPSMPCYWTVTATGS